jgi:cell division protease FtsH
MRGSVRKASKQQTASGKAFTGVIAAGWIVLQVTLGGIPALAKDECKSLSYSDLLKIDKHQKINLDNKSGCKGNYTVTVKKVEFDEAQQIVKVQLQGQEPNDAPQEVKLLQENSELIKQLRDSKVNFEERTSTDSRAAVGILVNLLWILPLMALFLLFLRRSSNASSQALNFGKSRARFQMEAKTGITFSDVAGIDEAKEELQEVVTFLKQPERFTAIGARIPKGVLLVGSPGTGKLY